MNLIDPTGILALGDQHHIGSDIIPGENVATGGKVEEVGLPVYFAGNASQQAAIDAELKEIVVGLRRNFPPEADVGDAANDRRHRTGLAGVDGATLGG